MSNTQPERTTRPGDSDAAEAMKSVVIRTADGDLVFAGEWVSEDSDAFMAGAPEPPDQTVITTGELYKPPGKPAEPEPES